MKITADWNTEQNSGNKKFKGNTVEDWISDSETWNNNSHVTETDYVLLAKQKHASNKLNIEDWKLKIDSNGLNWTQI